MMDFRIYGFCLIIFMFNFLFISSSPFSNRIAYHRAKLRQQHQRNQLPHMLRSRIGDGQETLFMLQNIPGKIPRYIKRNFKVYTGDQPIVEKEERATSKPIFHLDSYEDEYFTSTTLVPSTNDETKIKESTTTIPTSTTATTPGQKDLWSPLLIQAVINEKYGTTTTVEPVLPVVGADYTQVVPWSLLSSDIQQQLRRKGLVFAGYPIEYQSDLPPQNVQAPIFTGNQLGIHLNDMAPKYSNPYFM